jgi:hypothetical protein
MQNHKIKQKQNQKTNQTKPNKKGKRAFFLRTIPAKIICCKYITMPKISKTDERYEMLKNIPKKDLLFVRNQSNTTHTYVFLDNGPFSLSMTEYPEALIYLLYKNGLDVGETRHICR